MNADTRDHVHALVDQLSPVQLAAVEALLKTMLDRFPITWHSLQSTMSHSLKTTGMHWQKPTSEVSTTRLFHGRMFWPISA